MTLVFTLMLEMVLFLREFGAQSVTQPDAHITVSERDKLEMKCNYSISVPPYLFWYVQYPNQGLQLILKYTSGKTLVLGINGFKAEFEKEESSFHLRKPFALWSDSARYFCADFSSLTKVFENVDLNFALKDEYTVIFAKSVKYDGQRPYPLWSRWRC